MKLTICIPIYNCADFIGQALDSIMPQLTKDTEVVVYDGGSTDSTPEIMHGYLQRYKSLRYHRGNERGGIDVDLVKCVKYANGEYCWLFSGDDVMRPNSIQRMLDLIVQGDDIYICQHTICSIRMDIYHKHPVLTPNKLFRANFSNTNERNDWFKRAVTTEAFFSFLSGLIVRREKWLAGELPESFADSCWGHVARFFSLIPQGLVVCYVPEVLLDQRGDNDSFADKGFVNRYRIGISGYHKLANKYFGKDSNEAFHIRKVIRNEFTLIAFIGAKYRCKLNPEKESKQLLDSLFEQAYSEELFSIKLKRLLYHITSYKILLFLKLLYQPLKHLLRALKSVKLN